ncbi:MAG: transcriptional activator RfaH [Xanthobacteraceae bacterium]|nr:transcriptional activator RfaH [Xanthobacteraceae bacterium]
MNEELIRHWYVVQTQPHAERKASAHLMRQGFEIYLPQYLKRRRHARKIETVPAPLFPRYLFVLLDLATQPWRPIRSTVGVSQMVCRGDTPACVSPGVVEALKTREDNGGFIKLVNPVRFVRGDKIRVLDGVFSSLNGLYEEMSDAERVTVLLDLLGRKVRVVLDLDSVAAA